MSWSQVFAFVSKETCGECKAAKPAWRQLSSAFEHEASKLAIVTVNTTSPTLPAKLWRTVFTELEGFPSFFLRRAKGRGNEREPKEYPNTKSRKMMAIAAWLCHEMSHSVRFCVEKFGREL